MKTLPPLRCLRHPYDTQTHTGGGASPDGPKDTLQSGGQPVRDLFVGEPKHPIAHAGQPPIPPRVSGNVQALLVIRPIDLDDEADGRCVEVDDVFRDDDLTAKPDAKALGPNGSEQDGFSLSGIVTHVMRAGFELLTTMR